MPTFDRPRDLPQCLGALADLDVPRNCFEVVVVDDGSSPPLDHVVEARHDHLALRLIRQPNRGPGAVRNAGGGKAGEQPESQGSRA
ncbi:MAG: glycosyltransferase family 2 protein [bacterium]|nr:glycosyltransferase family 2 protein [bacterium]